MKPILLVVACIVLLILALYKYGVHANGQATSTQRKAIRNADAFSLDELRLNYLTY
ncbi:MAG TPA: hypothetical protein VFW07_22190 [Parafilimonas sp.]|nr:hypothetical protein [Parafilimonas sp.]